MRAYTSPMDLPARVVAIAHITPGWPDSPE